MGRTRSSGLRNFLGPGLLSFFCSTCCSGLQKDTIPYGSERWTGRATPGAGIWMFTVEAFLSPVSSPRRGSGRDGYAEGGFLPEGEGTRASSCTRSVRWSHGLQKGCYGERTGDQWLTGRGHTSSCNVVLFVFLRPCHLITIIFVYLLNDMSTRSALCLLTLAGVFVRQDIYFYDRQDITNVVNQWITTDREVTTKVRSLPKVIIARVKKRLLCFEPIRSRYAQNAWPLVYVV